MVQNISLDNVPSTGLSLPSAPAPAPAEPTPRGPSTPGGNPILTSQLGRAPAPPGSDGQGERLASRGAAPTPTPAPAPAPQPSSPEHALNAESHEELRNRQDENERLEEEQTQAQIRANTATTAHTLALKASERMGMSFKNGADIQSKLV
ncbi:hypothetical protein ACFX58_14440 [Sphingomonas sp. NCPPB 2930]